MRNLPDAGDFEERAVALNREAWALVRDALSDEPTYAAKVFSLTPRLVQRLSSATIEDIALLANVPRPAFSVVDLSARMQDVLSSPRSPHAVPVSAGVRGRVERYALLHLVTAQDLARHDTVLAAAFLNEPVVDVKTLVELNVSELVRISIDPSLAFRVVNPVGTELLAASVQAAYADEQRLRHTATLSMLAVESLPTVPA